VSGQASEVLYYSPYVKLMYAPLLATCVRTFANWHAFFAALFLGGSVGEAVALLSVPQAGGARAGAGANGKEQSEDPRICRHLSQCGDACLHIRSPICQKVMPILGVCVCVCV
jgi:hypothetical protein